jgi:type III pantothenate kinase
MILALDVGNSQIYGGLFQKNKDHQYKMKLSFRKNSKQGSSSDEVGVFLRTVLKENGFDPAQVQQIALCSVVPEVVYSLRGACKKYFDIDPFILQAGVRTGLKIKYRNPLEVGADRIANSIAAVASYPQKDLIIVDLGTATTFCAISKDKDYLGGSIVAGLKISMESLEGKTAKLPSVEIVSRDEALGRSTVESIQSGLYFGHLGTIKELCLRISTECFENKKPFIIGTGGFAYLFEKEKIFDVILPDLVLQGLLISLNLNQEAIGEK